jgi:N-acetylmuramoyl-L-alanine amidase CwlA
MGEVLKMSNSKLVSKTLLTNKNYDKGRSGYKIKKITIHHCAGIMTIEQLGRLMKNGSRQVSSHYGIGNDGRIGQFVDEKNTAWTDGNWVSNCTSVTIETSNNKTGGKWTVGEKALKSLIKLVADIGKRNNLGTLVKGKNVTWHRMYVSTTCPGDYLLSKMDYIISEANKLNKTVASKKKYTGTFPTLPSRGYFKNGDSGSQVKNLQKFLNWAVNSKLAVDGIIGTKTINVVKTFQKKVKISADGLFGKDSLAKAKIFSK